MVTDKRWASPFGRACVDQSQPAGKSIALTSHDQCHDEIMLKLTRAFGVTLRPCRCQI